MQETLQILNLRILYEPHWVGVEDGKIIYDHFAIGTSHEIEGVYLPKELYYPLMQFVENVETAYDRRRTEP